ncbi:DUF6191 domain-containing protein [Actinomadura sp. 9N215]|uniref:DUF6191 domain-containing protein n=1 Tax=Actinomadura sp. 9N215 TaxID=3375150 RepID=UPI0037B41763
MKPPFRRRKRVKGRAMGNRPSEPAEQETVEWPRDGTGKSTMMGAIRGDGKTGAGFGGGMFEDLASVFEGSKKIKVEEQERQKLLRQDDHEQTGSGSSRDDLDSGKIRIRRAPPPD